MALCRKLVEMGGALAFPCDLGLPEGHAGPCSCKEKPTSVALRQKWVDDNYPKDSGYVEPRRSVEFVVDPGSISPTPQPKKPEVTQSAVARALGMTDAELDVMSVDEIEERLHAIRRPAPALDMTAVHEVVEERPGINAYEPDPVQGEGDVLAEIIQDLTERREVGITKYGTPLQRFNGRNGLVDAYQETLDLVAYIRQSIGEMAKIRARVEILRALVVARGHEAEARTEVVEALDALLRDLPSWAG